MSHHNVKDLYQPAPQRSQYIDRDGSVSLVDLFVVLIKYKKNFLYVFSAVLMACLGGIYFLYVETHSLVSAIQIGSRESNNTILPIESPESLLSKVNSSILPLYTNKWMKENGVQDIFKTSSENPKSSDIILITNGVNEDSVSLMADFQKGLMNIIIDDHRRVITSLKSGVESEARLALLTLENLKNPVTLERKLKEAQIQLENEKIALMKIEDEKFFGVNKAEFQSDIFRANNEIKRLVDLEKGSLEHYKRIEENKKILLVKIDDLEAKIAEAEDNLRIASVGATELSAMSQLLMANQIQQNKDQLITLEQRYYIGLENEKTELLNEIESVKRKKNELENKVDLLNNKYSVLLENNELMRNQQKDKIEEVQVALKQIELLHNMDIVMQEEKVRELQTRLDNFSETRVVSTAVKSLRPIGVGKLQLIVASIFAALMAGFAAVLISIFSDKVKERLRVEAP